MIILAKLATRWRSNSTIVPLWWKTLILPLSRTDHTTSCSGVTMKPSSSSKVKASTRRSKLCLEKHALTFSSKFRSNKPRLSSTVRSLCHYPSWTVSESTLTRTSIRLSRAATGIHLIFLRWTPNHCGRWLRITTSSLSAASRSRWACLLLQLYRGPTREPLKTTSDRRKNNLPDPLALGAASNYLM